MSDLYFLLSCRDDQSSVGSHSEDHHHHHHHHHGHHSADPQRSDTSTHSEGSHPSRRARLVSHRSKGPSKSVSRSRSRSLSRTRQPVRRSTSYGMEQANSDSEGADEMEAGPSGSGGNFSRAPIGVCVTGLPLRSSGKSSTFPAFAGIIVLLFQEFLYKNLKKIWNQIYDRVFLSIRELVS